jgi:hypothetical protein
MTVKKRGQFLSGSFFLIDLRKNTHRIAALTTSHRLRSRGVVAVGSAKQVLQGRSRGSQARSSPAH